VTESPSQAPKDVIGFLDYYLVKKAPVQIPDAGRQWIVKWGPWITVVLLALSLPLVLALLGLGFLGPFRWYGYGYAAGFGVAAAFLLVHFVLMIMALPGLFARTMSGWRLMFYAQVAALIESLLYGAVISALVWALISFYIVFQVRTLYK
jgi:hypothetical protein